MVPRDEEGFTLIEIMISLWILSALMIAFIGALFTMTKASDYSRRVAVAENELRRLEGVIRSAPYIDCPDSTDQYPTEYIPASIATGPGWTYTASSGDQVTILHTSAQQIQYWKGTPVFVGGVPQTDTADLTQRAPAPPCPTRSGQPSDYGIQIMRLSVTVAGSPTVTKEQVDFIKRDG